jgi:transposase
MNVGRYWTYIPASERIKLVWWDGTGLCVMAKKLEQCGFRCARVQGGVMLLTAARLAALLEGSDWCPVHGGRRPIAPRLAG